MVRDSEGLAQQAVCCMGRYCMCMLYGERQRGARLSRLCRAAGGVALGLPAAGAVPSGASEQLLKQHTTQFVYMCVHTHSGPPLTQSEPKHGLQWAQCMTATPLCSSSDILQPYNPTSSMTFIPPLPLLLPSSALSFLYPF
jgi:hypothetical protein